MRTIQTGEGHRRRLRERFLNVGLDAFAPHEVVELLLTLAIPRRDVKPVAKDLVSQFGGLRGILNASREELLEIKGMGETGVFTFHFLRSLISVYLQSELEDASSHVGIEKLGDFWRARLGHEQNEVFEVAHFDPGMKVLRNGIVAHSRGAADRTAVFPGEVIRTAVKKNAYAVAFAHNHPSGDISPSDADKLLTKRLVLAATAAEIKVVDHLIVTPNQFFSFRSEGLL